jgi:phage-related protein (TIGR01555 family)
MDGMKSKKEESTTGKVKSWLRESVNNSRMVQLIDGWSNVLTGMNIRNRDARMSSCVAWTPMTEAQLEEFYAGDAIAARVCDLIVDTSLSKGWRITGVKPEQEDFLKSRAYDIGFEYAISHSAKKARIYGGAGIVKVYRDSLKLDTPKEEKSEILSLICLNRYNLEVHWEDVQKDIISPRYNQPVWYTYTRGYMESKTVYTKVHHSRVVRFDGICLPDELKKGNQWWGDSVISKSYTAIRNYADAHDGVNAALKDLSVGVFKLRGLADIVSADNDKALMNRLNIVNMGKSILRSIVIDAEGEDFDYKTRTLTGAVDLVEKAEDRLCAEVGIPKTVLFGQSPKGGLGQSGNHESEMWYSCVEAYQTSYLKPKMMEILVELAEEAGIPTDELDIEFNPLWQMSDKEEAEVRGKQSETDQRYIDMGVLSPEEVRESRFGGDAYSIETSLDDSIGADDLIEEPSDEELKAVKVNYDFIEERGGKWVVLSKSGKVLGTFSSKAEAEKRLKQIEWFKHKG